MVNYARLISHMSESFFSLPGLHQLLCLPSDRNANEPRILFSIRRLIVCSGNTGAETIPYRLRCIVYTVSIDSLSRGISKHKAQAASRVIHTMWIRLPVVVYAINDLQCWQIECLAAYIWPHLTQGTHERTSKITTTVLKVHANSISGGSLSHQSS